MANINESSLVAVRGPASLSAVGGSERGSERGPESLVSCLME